MWDHPSLIRAVTNLGVANDVKRWYNFPIFFPANGVNLPYSLYNKNLSSLEFILNPMKDHRGQISQSKSEVT